MNSKWQKYKRGMKTPAWATKVEARVLESGSIPTEEEHGFIFDLSTGFAYRKSSGETLWVRFHK